MALAFAFTADLWQHPQGSWYFVTVPHDIADELADHVDPGHGFGSVPVRVTVGATTWATSLFPDKSSASYVLPVKRAVRVAEHLEDGDPVDVTVAFEAPDPGPVGVP